jgi:hypothetical protein
MSGRSTDQSGKRRVLTTLLVANGVLVVPSGLLLLAALAAPSSSEPVLAVEIANHTSAPVRVTPVGGVTSSRDFVVQQRLYYDQASRWSRLRQSRFLLRPDRQLRLWTCFRIPLAGILVESLRGDLFILTGAERFQRDFVIDDSSLVEPASPTVRERYAKMPEYDPWPWILLLLSAMPFISFVCLVVARRRTKLHPAKLSMRAEGKEAGA